MNGWTIPAKSFDATTMVAPTGTPYVLQDGAAVPLEEVMAEHACQVVADFSATPDEILIYLQGSLDGTNWFTMTSEGVSAGAATGPVTVLLTATGAASFTRTMGYGSSNNPVVTTLLTSG